MTRPRLNLVMWRSPLPPCMALVGSQFRGYSELSTSRSPFQFWSRWTQTLNSPQSHSQTQRRENLLWYVTLKLCVLKFSVPRMVNFAVESHAWYWLIRWSIWYLSAEKRELINNRPALNWNFGCRTYYKFHDWISLNLEVLALNGQCKTEATSLPHFKRSLNPLVLF